MKSNIDFEQTTLGEVCDKIGSGATPRGGDKVYIASGIAQIRSQNVLDYSFSKQGLVYIDDESATALNNVTVHSNDVLFNITGDSVARACIAPDWVLPARVNQHVAIIRASREKADNRYLLYTLQHKKEILLALSSSGATRNAITKRMLSNLPLLLPPLPEQRAIAATLSCLDDKIELNNRMNKTLEEMAQAIFKSWFVDFEPFQDGEFVDSELGRIPKGWRVGTLGEIISTNLVSYSSNECWSYVDYLDTGSITENAIGQMQKIQLGVDKLPSRARRKVQKGDIVYSTVRPIQKHYGIITNPSDHMLVSTGFAVITSLYTPFIYCYLTQQSIIEHLDAIANQSVSTYPSIRADHIESLRLCIPPKDTLDHFCSALGAIYQSASVIQDEKCKLSTIRDSLLPKLMSGEIRVPTNP